MFELQKSFTFEAGHFLQLHEGKCFSPHGHSYTLTVTLRSDILHESGSHKGMVIDFHDIAVKVLPMIEKYFDHRWLNDSLETESPTAEYIARWIYLHLKPLIPQLYSITIAETNTAQATYWE